VKRVLNSGTIFIDYVKSKQNLVDHLPKPLGKNMILETSEGMELAYLKTNKFLMIFISLIGGAWFLAYAWWNRLYECQVGILVWDLGMISRALMNIKHVHGLVSATQR